MDFLFYSISWSQSLTFILPFKGAPVTWCIVYTVFPPFVCVRLCLCWFSVIIHDPDCSSVTLPAVMYETVAHWAQTGGEDFMENLEMILQIWLMIRWNFSFCSFSLKEKEMACILLSHPTFSRGRSVKTYRIFPTREGWIHVFSNTSKLQRLLWLRKKVKDI